MGHFRCMMGDGGQLDGAHVVRVTTGAGIGQIIRQRCKMGCLWALAEDGAAEIELHVSKQVHGYVVRGSKLTK
jgi:hypothetical protein